MSRSVVRWVSRVLLAVALVALVAASAAGQVVEYRRGRTLIRVIYAAQPAPQPFYGNGGGAPSIVNYNGNGFGGAPATYGGCQGRSAGFGGGQYYAPPQVYGSSSFAQPTQQGLPPGFVCPPGYNCTPIR